MITVDSELLRLLITGLYTLRISRTRTFLCLCMPRKKDGKIKPITPGIYVNTPDYNTVLTTQRRSFAAQISVCTPTCLLQS
jgi:hypothetical protein